MESDIVELVPSSGGCREKRDPVEWLDLKSRVEEEKFRKLSADLERRRARRFLQHAEEERKVAQELNSLHRDRLRFERERQLRQRNSFSSSRERRHSTSFEQKSLEEQKLTTRLPMNETSFGASASLAFDPTVIKSSRPQRKTSREGTLSYGSIRKASKELSSSNGFPYIGEDEVQRFHKMCKSASKSECRRWSAAWFYAKKEQDIADDTKKRWTSLLLKSEKDKMRVLSAKRAAFLANEFDGKSLRDYGSNIDRKPPKGKENNGCFGGRQYFSSDVDQEKESSDSRESVEVARDDKLTFHKAFSLPLERTKENNGCKVNAEIAKNAKLTFHKAFSFRLEETNKSNGTDENETSLEAFSLPSVDNASKDGGKFDEKIVPSQNSSVLSSVDCKKNSTLFKGSYEDKRIKRSKKIRKCTEENEDFQKNALPRMPVIPELDTEESSSASSSEKSKNFTRRKRTVCFLPNLAKES